MFQFFPATQIHLLTRKDLEKLFIESNEQITPIEERKRALEREVQDMEVEIARRTIQRETSEKEDKVKASLTPLSLKAAERHLINVRAKREDLLAELDKQNQDIENLELELARLRKIVRAYTTIPRDSLKVGPFNNSTLRKICTHLEALAEGEDFDGDINLCLNILSGDSTMIAEHMHYRSQIFNERIEEIFAQIQELVAAGEKMKENIRLIQLQMDHLTKDPSSEGKEQSVHVVGEEAPPEEQLKKQETLSDQKNNLEREIEELETKLTRSPLESKEAKENLTLIRRYKCNATSLVTEIHREEMLKKHHLMEIEDYEKCVQEIEANLRIIDEAINEMKEEGKKQQWKIDLFKEQGLTSEDVSLLMDASKSTTIFQMKLSNHKLQAREIKSKEEKKVVSERVQGLRTLIKDMDDDIVRKERLIQAHE